MGNSEATFKLNPYLCELKACYGASDVRVWLSKKSGATFDKGMIIAIYFSRKEKLMVARRKSLLQKSEHYVAPAEQPVRGFLNSTEDEK